jgi:hypothetical protein
MHLHQRLFVATAARMPDKAASRGVLANNRTQKRAVNPLTRLASRSVMAPTINVAAS